MKPFTIAMMFVLAVSVAGCSALKKVTGETDDTVLSGQREEVIPPDQMTAKDPVVSGQGQAADQMQDQAPADQQITAAPVPCNPKKQKCPAIKQVQ
jgi:hypothetical protein